LNSKVPSGTWGFGDHNPQPAAAWLAAKELGMDARTFTQAISDFTGASSVLSCFQNALTNVVEICICSIKVKATIQAVKQQFPDRKLIAVLELHTYSSLNGGYGESRKHGPS
jgi:UDP-N-acetylmuramate: L-alanyl-gamma-D-glutamyl-meso-diaminopimelate ligase